MFIAPKTTFKPRAVVFDCDGVLIDSEAATQNSLLAAARPFNIELDKEVLLRIVGLPTHESFRLLSSEVKDFATVADQIMRNSAEYLWEQIRENGLKRCAGVEELLELLEKLRLPCAVASCSDRNWIESTMGNLRPRFSTIVSLEDVTQPKPAPDVYHLAAQRLGIPERECLAIEDSDAGVRAAAAAGMQVIMVPSIKPPSAESLNLAMAVMPSLHPVAEYLKEMFRKKG